MTKNKENVPAKAVESLFNKISPLITQSRKMVASTINAAEVCTKFKIGQYIVEDEQKGKNRAAYGKQVLIHLSARLIEKHGEGWSVETLTLCRKFFNVYSNFVNSVYEIEGEYKFTLSWSHYLVLMRIKNPVTLEFVGLKPDASYSESKLESAIIGKLQDFLLELGKGFLFEARQKRFSFDEDNYYVDLVLYNRLLQCYVLVDLKVDKLTHQDLGQMQMYVNYYDRYVKQDFEKPTIGILLCKEKKDTLVKLTLPEDANIYASAYELYLPDKKLLQAKVKEWVNEFENAR